MKRVAITGMGVISPLGNTVEEFWRNIIQGKSGSAPITKFDTSKFKTNFACEVKDFNPELYMDKKEIKKFDLFTQYAIAASEQAITDAKLNFSMMDEETRSEIGVIWASGYGGITTFEKELTEFISGDGTPHFNPYFIPKIIVNIAAGVISIKHKLHGPNYATVSACASSSTAIICAFDTIRLGKAKIIITGGSEAAISPSSIGGFNASHALSKNNADPQKASRPFDKDRDGFVAGEGAGALILEDYEHAVDRGAKIYGEMVAGGMAADAYHLTGTHPDGYGASIGINNALTEANIDTSDIDYINAHATSTPQGDLSELKAIHTIFGDLPVSISATKSMTGHLLGAAGAIESIITILAVKNNIVPGTINVQNLDPLISDDLNIVIGKSISKKIRYGLNNTFGFGGHIATIIFKK